MSRRRMAVLASAGTSALFLVVYGASNALAAARGSAGSFHFGWETSIPLVPAMIVPWAWAVLPLWSALSLAIIALGYGWLGPRVFRKYAGYLSIPARVVLGPYLLGLSITRRWYWARGSVEPTQVGGGVCFGRLPNGRIALDAAVIDLTAEHDGARGPRYSNYPVLDLTMPDRATLDAISDRIEQDRACGTVYVHCALGLGRSAHAVAWWLHRSGRARSFDEALETVRAG